MVMGYLKWVVWVDQSCGRNADSCITVFEVHAVAVIPHWQTLRAVRAETAS